MDIVAAVAGMMLVGLVVWEVFNDLFHPTNSGALSDWLGRRLFNLFRRTKTMLPLAGPLALVSTIATWVSLLMLGFACIFYGSVPAGFRTSTAEVPQVTHRFATALYVSAQTLTTLAFGDVVGFSGLMRAAAAIEGLIGFGVLTASVSSIVLMYPALSRMRLLARGVTHIAAAERSAAVRMARTGSDLIHANLARDVTNTRIDLIHFPILYYFTTVHREGSVAFALPHLVRFAREGQQADVSAHVRLAAASLDRALDDLADVLAVRFLEMDGKDRDAVFAAFARDHAVEIE
jgi:hypothetical protein